MANFGSASEAWNPESSAEDEEFVSHSSRSGGQHSLRTSRGVQRPSYKHPENNNDLFENRALLKKSYNKNARLISDKLNSIEKKSKSKKLNRQEVVRVFHEFSEEIDVFLSSKSINEAEYKAAMDDMAFQLNELDKKLKKSTSIEDSDARNSYVSNNEYYSYGSSYDFGFFEMNRRY